MALNVSLRRGRSNPLIRRVQRHADLSTLFRAAQEDGQPEGFAGSNAQPGFSGPSYAAVPLVSARLLPSAEAGLAPPVIPGLEPPRGLAGSAASPLSRSSAPPAWGVPPPPAVAASPTALTSQRQPVVQGAPALTPPAAARPATPSAQP